MDNSAMLAYLRSVVLMRDRVPTFHEYPFNLPAVAAMDGLHFHPKVTYIVGENGMGKSTLLEAIAAALGFNPEGGTINFSFLRRRRILCCINISVRLESGSLGTASFQGGKLL